MPGPFLSEAHRRWFRRGRWPLALAALAVAGLAAFAYFEFVKAPPDVSNPKVGFHPRQQPRKHRDRNGADWPLYGGNPQRSRYLPAKRSLGPPFDRVWSFRGAKLIEFSPILVNGRLFVAKNSGGLFALNARTGRVIWKRQSGYKNASSPAYGKGRVYVVSLHPSQISAYRAAGGKLVWRKSLPGRSESSPVYAGGRIYFGCECGLLYALDADTGRTVWTARLGGAVKGAPALDHGTLYAGDYGGRIWAVRARNGSIRWSTGSLGGSFGRAGRFYSTPTVAFGRVYAGSLDGRVYSFSAQSGALAWSHSTGGYVYASPAVADTPRTGPTVYIGSYDGNFYALDARSGSVRWTHSAGGKISGAASVVGETVYYSNLGDHSSTGLSTRTGRAVFHIHRGAFNPVISDGRWIFLTGYSQVYALRPEKTNSRRRSAGRDVRPVAR